MNFHEILLWRQRELSIALIHSISNKYNILSFNLEELEEENEEDRVNSDLISTIAKKRKVFNDSLAQMKSYLSPNVTVDIDTIHEKVRESWKKKCSHKVDISNLREKAEGEEIKWPFIEGYNLLWLLYYYSYSNEVDLFFRLENYTDLFESSAMTDELKLSLSKLKFINS